MRIVGLAISTGVFLLLVLANGRVPRPAVANPVIEISPVSLTRESVRMEVTPESLVVHGLYSFRRLGSSHVCPIYFPFPLDSTANRPRLLSASMMIGNGDYHPIRVDDRQNPWFVEVLTGEADSFSVSLTYSQGAGGTRASYPLTSRYRWFIPTESIRIEVAMSAGTPDPVFSFPCSAVTDGRGTRTYVWSSNGPLPEHDMEVRWRGSGDTRTQGNR